MPMLLPSARDATGRTYRSPADAVRSGNTQALYPYSRTGYDHVQQSPQQALVNTAEASRAEMAAHAHAHRRASQADCSANSDAAAVPSAPPPPACAVVAPGDPQRFERRLLSLNRKFPDETWMTQAQHAGGNTYAHQPMTLTRNGKARTTPAVHEFSAHAFQTRYTQAEPMVSTGVMTNTFTNQTFETFVNAMPPPNRNHTLTRDQLRRTNPKLAWMNGGVDPNRLPARKSEICQDVPGHDAGPNVWGDQLYDGERRARTLELTERDMYTKRDGVFAFEQSMNGERPAGYVGLQPAYRALPYLLPTQNLELRGWTPGMDGVNGLYESATNPLSTAHVFTRRPDYADAGRGLARPADGTQATGQTASSYVVRDVTPRPTLKQQMEVEFPSRVVDGVASGTGHAPYVVRDVTPRPTLKQQMEVEFPSRVADGTQATGQTASSYVVRDATPRPTLKQQMEVEFPALNAGAETQAHGERLEFQGAANPTRRQYYSAEELRGLANGERFGDFVGGGQVHVTASRGTLGTFYPLPNLVPAQNESGQSGARVFGYSTRDVRPELEASVPPAASYATLGGDGASFEGLRPRMIPSVVPSCNVDVQESRVSATNPRSGVQGENETTRQYVRNAQFAANA